jgi:hypothetical protein
LLGAKISACRGESAAGEEETPSACAVAQVNGEPQKKAEEITAEVAIALTLSELHPEAGMALSPDTLFWCLQGFCGACTATNSTSV